MMEYAYKEMRLREGNGFQDGVPERCLQKSHPFNCRVLVQIKDIKLPANSDGTVAAAGRDAGSKVK